jgi:nucleotide-binding universal stress UspA family protein
MITTIPVERRRSPMIVPNPARRGPVLLAIHGEELSDAPLLVARRLAERLQRELRVVSVIEPLPMYSAEIAAYAITFDDDRQAARERVIRERLSTVVDPELTWSIDVRVGQPAREIRAAAHEVNASLIIVAAAPHRRGGRVVAGQRAGQILRGAGSPVLSVAPGFAGLPTRILVAIDFSAASVAALQTALLMADNAATVVLLHVAPPLDLAQRDSGAVTDFSEPFARVIAEVAPYAPPGVTFETRVVTGGVASEVLSAATHLVADLVVSGTHGPNVVERMFLGSVAGSVLTLGECSVLVSPAPPPAEAIRLQSRLLGTALTAAPHEWGAVLDAFSRDNAGRPVTIEVDDPAFGAQVQARGYVLWGTTYDPADRCIEIMLGATDDSGAHLTRTIANPESVALNAAPNGRAIALEVRHGAGHTLVLLDR